MSAERVKETAKQVVEATDRSLQSMADIDVRDYREQASSLRSAGENIPPLVSSVIGAISTVRQKLEACRDNNLLVEEALKDQPPKEVSAIQSYISDLKGGIGAVEKESLKPAEGRLGILANTVEAVQEYAGVIDSLAPDPDGPESGWRHLHFAYKALKRVWSAI